MEDLDSIKQRTEDNIMSLRRDLMYECSVFLFTCWACKKERKPYQDLAGVCQELVERLYQDVLNKENSKTKFCYYLFNHVNLRQQKSDLGASLIQDYRHLVPEWWIFVQENITTQPDGEKEMSESYYEEGPIRDVNRKYYKELEREQMREIVVGHKMEVPEGGWTFENWNQARAARYYKLLDVWDDPELWSWEIVMRRIYGVERFICGSVRENVVTSLLDHPDYGDTDVDTMYCSPIPGTLHDVVTRPGYTRIRVEEGVTGCETDDDKFMLSSQHNLRYLQRYQNDETRPPGVRTFTSISGPALAYYADSDQMVKSQDVVFGLYQQDRTWPAVAEEWWHRKRPSGWPTQALIDRAISYGTYVVPVAHKNSDNPDVEWRYSFSRAEVDLMLSVTPRQRKCYMLTKRLCKLVFSGLGIFCSYFIKTSFFWLLEEKPAVYWEMMSMDDLVHYLLDKMICFLSGHDLFLPNYFIREANLMDYLHRDHIATIREKLKSLWQRRVHSLPPYVLKDVCLYLINMDVDPDEKFSHLSLPQHWVVYLLQYNKYLSHSVSPEISKLLHKYWRLSQKRVCGSFGSEPISDSEPLISQDKKMEDELSLRTIPDLLEKIRRLGPDGMLEILVRFSLEEINHQLSRLMSEISIIMADISGDGANF